MKKVNLIAILTIFLIALIIGLTRYGSIKDKIGISESPNPSMTTVIDKPTKPSVSPYRDDIKTIDFNQYLKKIWVVKNWDGGAYYYFSFFITKIENGVIEGKLSTGGIGYPDFHIYRLEPSKYLGDLSGIVNNGIAECRFSGTDVNKGDLTLIFKENDELEAKIKYTSKRKDYIDGDYICRPYKLSDIKDFIPRKEHSFVTDLNSWGGVNFVSGDVDHGDRVYPAAYLTNDNGDILYKFQAPFQTGFKVIEASIKDLNNDGLKDVKITIGLIKDPNVEGIEWIFYQMNNGLFYDSRLNGS